MGDEQDIAVQHNNSAAAQPVPGRERILTAAYHLFLERGYADVSMQEIADAAGVTKGAPYYHFRDKEELFGEVFRRELASVRAGFVDRLEQDGPLRQRLEAVADFILARSHTDVSRLFADFRQHLSPQRRREVATQEESPLDVIRPYFRQAATAGEFKSAEPDVAAALFLAMLFGVVRASAFRPSDGDHHARPAITAVAIVDVLFNGI